jgi:hypothetical protein
MQLQTTVAATPPTERNGGGEKKMMAWWLLRFPCLLACLIYNLLLIFSHTHMKWKSSLCLAVEFK